MKIRLNIINKCLKLVVRDLICGLYGYCGSWGKYGIMVEEIKKR